VAPRDFRRASDLISDKDHAYVHLTRARRDAGVLTYHVVTGEVRAADVVKLQSAKAVSGDTITVKVRDGKVHVDGANVTKTDIQASNGVIHVIDTVILPKGL
jgi:uncharacterized surface protein with fasciclin (FAS1) repeats